MLPNMLHPWYQKIKLENLRFIHIPPSNSVWYKGNPPLEFPHFCSFLSSRDQTLGVARINDISSWLSAHYILSEVSLISSRLGASSPQSYSMFCAHFLLKEQNTVSFKQKCAIFEIKEICIDQIRGATALCNKRSKTRKLILDQPNCVKQKFLFKLIVYFIVIKGTGSRFRYIYVLIKVNAGKHPWKISLTSLRLSLLSYKMRLL